MAKAMARHILVSYIRYKSIYMAMSGQTSDAISLAKKELHGVRKEALTDFLNRLSSI